MSISYTFTKKKNRDTRTKKCYWMFITNVVKKIRDLLDGYRINCQIYISWEKNERLNLSRSSIQIASQVLVIILYLFTNPMISAKWCRKALEVTTTECIVSADQNKIRWCWEILLPKITKTESTSVKFWWTSFPGPIKPKKIWFMVCFRCYPISDLPHGGKLQIFVIECKHKCRISLIEPAKHNHTTKSETNYHHHNSQTR